MATESSSNSGLSLQEQLFAGIKVVYPAAEAKKINKDNFLDIYIPSVSPARGTHLFFNTVKGAIKVGYYTRDEDFINKVVSQASESIDAASNGLRIKGNPKFDDVNDALSAAFDFLSNILNENPINTITEENSLIKTESNDDVTKKFRESYADEEELAESLSSYLDDYSEKGKIVVLQIEEEDLINSTNNHDLLSGDLFTMIGVVDIQSWKPLSKLIGKEESDWVNNEFKDEDPSGIVLLYCDGKYVYSFSKPKEEEDFDEISDELVDALFNSTKSKDNQSLMLDKNTIPQIIEEIRAVKKLKQIEITYYINDYSDLYFGLVYKVNNCNVEVNRVNWYNDSYWTGEIEREQLIEGLTEYLNGQINGLELFDEYIHADDWKFDRAGTLDNGVEFSITDLNGLTDIPKNLQDEDGELDVWELSNYLGSEEEDLYDENIGRTFSYEFSLNGKTYGLIIDRSNEEKIDEEEEEIEQYDGDENQYDEEEEVEEEEVEVVPTNKYPISDYSDLKKLIEIIKEDIIQIHFADESLLQNESNLKELIKVDADIFPLLPVTYTSSDSIRKFAAENGYYDSTFLEYIDLKDQASLYKVIENNSNYYEDLPDEYKNKDLTKISIKNQSADITFDILPSNLQNDPEFFEELLTYLKEDSTYLIPGLSYSRSLLQGYQQFFSDDADFIVKNGLLNYADDDLLKDENFSFNYLKANPNSYSKLINKNNELKTNEAFARLAVEVHGAMNYPKLPDEFRQNREILNIALKSAYGGLMLTELPNEVLLIDGNLDLDLVISIIKENPFNISKVPNSFMMDKDIAMRYILAAKAQNNVLYYAPEFLRKDKDFVRKLANDNIFTVTFAHKSILADREFMKGIIAKMPVLIKYCSAELKADKHFVKEAVSLNGLVIRYIDEKLLSDPEIYWAALHQNPESYKLLLSETYNDKEVLDYISKINGGIFSDFMTSSHAKPIQFNSILNSAEGSYTEELKVLKTLGDKLSKDEILEMIKIDPSQVIFLSEGFLLKNKDLLVSILEITSYPLKFKSCRKALGEQELKKQLKTHSWALQYLGEDESLADEFLKELLSINGNLLQFLSQEQKMDNSFVEIALKRNPEACHFVSKEFDWTTEEAKFIAKQILSIDPLLLSYFIERDPEPLDEFFEHAYMLDSSVLDLMDHTLNEDAWYFVSDSNGSYSLSEDQLTYGLNQNGQVFHYEPIRNTEKNICLAIENGVKFTWDKLFTNCNNNLQIIEKAFEYYPSEETYQALKKELGKKFNENDYVNAQVVARGAELYPLISEGLKKNRELAHAYLRSDNFYDLSSKFEQLPSSFKKDEVFLNSLLGFKIDFEVLDGFFDHSLLYNEAFLIPYLELNFDQYTYLPEKLQKTKNLALQYGINNNEESYWGLTELALPEKLSQDKELILAIAKGNKSRNLKFDDALLNDQDFLCRLIEFQPQLVKALEEENRNLTLLMKLIEINIDVFDYLELEEKFIPEIFNFIAAHDPTKICSIEWSYTLQDSLIEITEKLNITNYINLFEESDFGDALSAKYTIESILLNKQADQLNTSVGTQYYIAEPGTITLGYDRNCYLSEDVAGEVSDEIILEFLESDDGWSEYIYSNSWHEYNNIYHTHGMVEPATDMQLPNGKIIPIALKYERPDSDNLKVCFNNSSKGSFVHIAVSDEKAYGWGEWKSYTLEVKPGVFDINNISVEFDSGIVSSYSYNLPDGDYDQFEENEDYTTTGQGFSSTLYFNNGKELIDADDVKDLLEENEIDTTDIEAIKEFLMQHYE
jgi:hypothetical protein